MSRYLTTSNYPTSVLRNTATLYTHNIVTTLALTNLTLSIKSNIRF